MTPKPVLAWFRLEDVAPETFHARVVDAGATYEGAGVDRRTGDVEAYAVFPSKARCEAFARRSRGCTLLDMVT